MEEPGVGTGNDEGDEFEAEEQVVVEPQRLRNDQQDAAHGHDDEATVVSPREHPPVRGEGHAISVTVVPRNVIPRRGII